MEQNQHVPACLSGTKQNNTWVNTAKAAIDKSATQEPSDLWNAGDLPESSNGKEYDEPHMFESEDEGRDINYIRMLQCPIANTSVIYGGMYIAYNYTHLISGTNMSGESQFSSFCFQGFSHSFKNVI